MCYYFNHYACKCNIQMVLDREHRPTSCPTGRADGHDEPPGTREGVLEAAAAAPVPLYAVLWK